MAAPGARAAVLLGLPLILAGLSACESTEGNVALGIIGATFVGGQAPTHEIEQIYYLGAFDPQGQLPPQVYRVRVHGQASFIGFMRFASGWVHASLIDSLGSSVGFNKEGVLSRRRPTGGRG